MKKGTNLMLALLTLFLALPGIAGADGEAKQAKPKPVITAPSECRVKKKVTAPGTGAKRRQIVADRQSRGEFAGPQVKYNEEAARQHGRKKQD